jgi:hypothetical protein
MSDVFISYSRKDLNRAKEIVSRLTQEGWSVFWDQRITIGSKYYKILEKEIYTSRVIVVLWSQNSIESDWVIIEATEGKDRGVLVPVLLENVKIPFGFKHLQTADLSDWIPSEADTLGMRQFIEAISLIGNLKQRLELKPKSPYKETTIDENDQRKFYQESDEKYYIETHSYGLAEPETIFNKENVELKIRTVFFDDFEGYNMNHELWHLPTWVSPNDGTFIHRTQFRCSQNSPLPIVEMGHAIINFETYNPSSGYSFLGTDLITNSLFSRENGLIFTIRARIKQPFAYGIVIGIGLWSFNATDNSHNEICFVLDKDNKVLTYISNNEPLGIGHPKFASKIDSIADFHTYVINWLPDQISWEIDGKVVRTDGTLVLNRPMHFHINIWTPNSNWAHIHNSSLQPTDSSSLNQIYSLIVDYVKVDSLVNSTSV